MSICVMKKSTDNLEILNVYLENFIFHLIGSGILNVTLQIFSVLNFTQFHTMRLDRKNRQNR